MAMEATAIGVEPKAASIPPGGKRYSIIVEGVTNGELMHAWNEMCQPGKVKQLSAFKEVYGNMTTVQGNRFNFRGGDPSAMKDYLKTLFQDKLKGNLSVHQA